MTDPGGGLRERKKLQTWRALRATALRLATEKGVEQVSIEEIAAAANVSKRTLFNYFETKEDLLFGPDPQEPQRLAEILAARPADEPVWTSLREIMLAYAAAHETKMALFRRLITDTPSVARYRQAAEAMVGETVSRWVAGRVGGSSADAVSAAILTNTALTLLGTAFNLWQPEQGPQRLAELIAQGFDMVDIR